MRKQAPAKTHVAYMESGVPASLASLTRKSAEPEHPMTLTHLALLLAAAGVLALGGAPLVALIAAATVAYLTGDDA